MKHAAILIGLLVVTVSSTKYWLYAGAGGCDSDDPTCKRPPSVDLSTIYIIDFDSSTGSMTLVSKQTGFSPIWLRLHPSKKILFAVNNDNGVVSLGINTSTGALTRISSVKTPGGVVFMDVDPLGSHLFVSSYTQGSIAMYPLTPDGNIGAIASFVQFHGHGTNPARQEAPHPHSINVAGRFVLIPDLGLDIVFSFAVTDVLMNTTYTNTTHLYAGAGPRHMAFHPTLSIAYLVCEMGSTVSVFTYESSRGELVDPPLQTLKTLPDDFKAFSKAAEVIITPSGKWLFASNRGFGSPTNSITVFSVDDTGRLKETGRYNCGGAFPRGMVFVPDGNILIVGGQDSNNVVTLKFDPATGSLAPPTSNLLNIATPVTFAFVEQANQ